MTTAGVSTSPPSVTTQSPAPGETSVSIASPMTATFNTSIDPTTLTFTLTDSSGDPVPASVTYDNSTDTATLSPDTTLGLDAAYTASVIADDGFGNAMTQPVTWSFTTAGTLPAAELPMFDMAEFADAGQFCKPMTPARSSSERLSSRRSRETSQACASTRPVRLVILAHRHPVELGRH